MGLYHKSVVADGIGSIQINFDIIGFNTGQKFDAIVYIEQLMFSKMAFLSDVIQESVGKITIDTIHEISEIYPQDNDYVYLSLEGKSTDLNYYFSYLPEKSMDVPFGALRIELDETAKGNFTGMYCAFVDNNTDALGRIQAIEKMIDEGDSYCIGERSRIKYIELKLRSKQISICDAELLHVFFSSLANVSGFLVKGLVVVLADDADIADH